MELYEVKNGLERARLLLNELFVSIDIEGLKREIEGLTVQTLDEHFWNNQEQAKKIYNQLNEMKKMMKMFTSNSKGMKKRGGFPGLPFFR